MDTVVKQLYGRNRDTGAKYKTGELSMHAKARIRFQSYCSGEI